MKKLSQNKINFIARLAEQSSAEAKKARKLKVILPLVLPVALLLILCGYFGGRIFFELNPKLAAVERQMAETQLAANYELALQQQEQADQLVAGVDQLESALVNIGMYPQVDATLWHNLTAAGLGKIRITGVEYERESGKLALHCRADNPLEASVYAQALTRNSELHGLYYYGYNSDEGANDTDQDFYKFTVVCALPGEGGQVSE